MSGILCLHSGSLGGKFVGKYASRPMEIYGFFPTKRALFNNKATLGCLSKKNTHTPLAAGKTHDLIQIAEVKYLHAHYIGGLRAVAS